MNQLTYENSIGISLVEKIEYAKTIIKLTLDQYADNELYLAWTGGKDSTLVLWLFRQVCRERNRPLPKAMFIDEGSVFEEILEVVQKIKKLWGVQVIFAKNTDVSDKAREIGDIINVAELKEQNRREIEKLGYTETSFPFNPESLVGNHLMKTVAMKSFLKEYNVKALITAIRWDEQEARTKETFFSYRQIPDHMRIHPILQFSERDIWNTIHKYEIPFCSLYYQGYRSLGAKCSTTKMMDIPAWEQDLENTPERFGRGREKEEVMAQLRALGYM